MLIMKWIALMYNGLSDSCIVYRNIDIDLQIDTISALYYNPYTWFHNRWDICLFSLTTTDKPLNYTILCLSNTLLSKTE